MQQFVLPVAFAEAIVEHARAADPEEACGLLSGAGDRATAVYPGRNVSPNPTVAFEMDGESLALLIAFEDDGLELAGIYHSHPAGPAFPSATDVEQAFYPDAVQIICAPDDSGKPVLRAFRIVNGQVTEVALVPR